WNSRRKAGDLQTGIIWWCQMSIKKTLNVGAGERTFINYPTKEYRCINFDERPLKDIDIVGDVKDLSGFKDEEFDFILASDIIEHFPIKQTEGILKEWKRVLKKGGIIEFRLPNLEAICKQYIKSKNARNISWLLYGGQTYSGNFHYVGFDRAFFKEECSKVDLEEISYSEEGFNMIIRTKKVK
ncbi:MAG: methyltransferase domain-containing protein, partial [Campylobacterota bacterium]|nr:methyltransferase domain-containing protein [Campylobacterota bacterium]